MKKNPTTEKALTACIKAARKGAEPWRIPQKLQRRLRDMFRADFEQEVSTPAEWRAWSPKALRLSGYLGTFAAFLAERDAPGARPGAVKETHLLGAVAMVKEVCPPPSEEIVAFGRLCRGVAVSADLSAKAQQLFRATSAHR